MQKDGSNHADMEHEMLKCSNKELSKIAKNNKVHDPVHISHFPPELEQIIKVWPELPEHIKAAVKALVDTHKMKE